MTRSVRIDPRLSNGTVAASIRRAALRGDRSIEPSGRKAVRRFQPAAEELAPVALSHGMGDYAIIPAHQHGERGVKAFALLSDPCHYRLEYAQSHAAGHAEFCGISDGFFVFCRDSILNGNYAMAVSAPDMLRVRIASESDSEYVGADGEVLDLRGPSAAIIIEPSGSAPAEGVLTGRNRAVHVYIHRDALAQLYTDAETGLPAEVRAFLVGDLRKTVARRLPLNPAMLRCLEDIQTCTLEGRSRRLFIQSTAVNILCHAFDALAHEDSFGSSDASALTTRGVLRAQRLLMENFVTPPSLDDLAQEVGLSRTCLCVGFRQLLGQSVFDFIVELRMQEALALMTQSDTSITQIAHAVGYGHLSSFTTAVQRRFGTTPSELRKGHFGSYSVLETTETKRTKVTNIR